MSDSGNGWFHLEEQTALKFAMKHKPRFVELADGRTVMVIHPEDAHLFTECEISTDPEEARS